MAGISIAAVAKQYMATVTSAAASARTGRVLGLLGLSAFGTCARNTVFGDKSRPFFDLRGRRFWQVCYDARLTALLNAEEFCPCRAVEAVAGWEDGSRKRSPVVAKALKALNNLS